MLKGKRVVITGGGRGIGFAAAVEFRKVEAEVIITGRNLSTLQKAAESIGIGFVVMDVSDHEQCTGAFKGLLEDAPIDILVNNAGITQFKSLSDHTIEEWNAIISTNLTGTFSAVKAVLPSMIAQNSGCIVNVASVAAQKPFAGGAAYGASKAGMVMLTDILREEVRAHNIRVTSVLPGATSTEIWDDVDVDFDKAKMIKPEAVGAMIVSACTADDSTVLENIVMRPAGGDF